MKPGTKILFIIFVAAQIGVLFFMAGRRELLLRNGTKIILKCEPVDPRSFFSGEYVTLQYTVSTIDEKLFTEADFSPKENDTIYVLVAKNEKTQYWTERKVSRTMITDIKNTEIVLKGVVDNPFSRRVRFGAEDYFVPQGEGKKIEENIRDCTAEVSVSTSGECALSKLFVDGKEVIFY